MGFAIDLRLPFRKYRRQEEELARAGNPTITLAFKVNSSEGLPLSAAATFTEMRIIIRRYRMRLHQGMKFLNVRSKTERSRMLTHIATRDSKRL